ncbi:MAG: hypothetical protein LLH30_10210 [Candidatus Manganitrophus sp. SA1]|nr:hypothetical protein [Candidatus Manganitrophus morganii]
MTFFGIGRLIPMRIDPKERKPLIIEKKRSPERAFMQVHRRAVASVNLHLISGNVAGLLRRPISETDLLVSEDRYYREGLFKQMEERGGRYR